MKTLFWYQIKQWLAGFVVVLMVSLLSACKTELYGDLSEQEANEMYAILYNAGISVVKETEKGRLVTLSVEENQSALAIELLKSQGFPKDQFTSLGEVFSKEGIISSPVEEQARLIYALSQEVSSTLSQIDGVLTARVHVVMPEKTEFGEKTAPPSASVFLKHTPKTNVESLRGKIKELVANSIHELDSSQVSVAFFPAQTTLSEGKLDIQQGWTSSTFIVGGIILILLLGGLALFVYYYIYRKKNSSQEHTGESVTSS